MRDDIYMLWLSSKVNDLGSRKLNGLLEIFGTARDVFNADKQALQERAKLTPHAMDVLTSDCSLDYIESMMDDMESKGIMYLSRNSDIFPILLKTIPDPPLGIFFIGMLPADDTNKIAIIGSRKCSEYGLMTARLLAKPLAQAGVVVVSGMARGVDSMAHRGALDGGGKTIAVLGCGVDICYPSENAALRQEIIGNGCVMSEYPPGTRPLPAYFPARNRIISGLSHGVVVTEAGKKSGTLITVDQAMEQGREVLAVPGNISSKLSQGTNALIRDGAHPVADYTDVLSVMSISTPRTVEKTKKQAPRHKKEAIQQTIIEKIPQNLAPDEKQVYDSLTLEAISFDTLLDKTDIEPGRLHLICMGLELKGLARKLPGSRYIRS